MRYYNSTLLTAYTLMSAVKPPTTVKYSIALSLTGPRTLWRDQVSKHILPNDDRGGTLDQIILTFLRLWLTRPCLESALQLHLKAGDHHVVCHGCLIYTSKPCKLSYSNPL